jgi:hypothetical protein
MQAGISHKEAVRLAREKLGEATAQELAAYIEQTFGLSIKPPIVLVLLGSLQERETLDRSGRAAYEMIQQWKADNPQEAKKRAAAAKRREAAKRTKPSTPTPTGEVADKPLDPVPSGPEPGSGGANVATSTAPEGRR